MLNNIEMYGPDKCVHNTLEHINISGGQAACGGSLHHSIRGATSATPARREASSESASLNTFATLQGGESVVVIEDMGCMGCMGCMDPQRCSKSPNKPNNPNKPDTQTLGRRVRHGTKLN